VSRQSRPGTLLRRLELRPGAGRPKRAGRIQEQIRSGSASVP